MIFYNKTKNAKSLKDWGFRQMPALLTLSDSPGLDRSVPSSFKTKYPIKKNSTIIFCTNVLLRKFSRFYSKRTHVWPKRFRNKRFFENWFESEIRFSSETVVCTQLYGIFVRQPLVSGNKQYFCLNKSIKKKIYYFLIIFVWNV